MLQWYPKHYNLYQTHLRHESYVTVKGEVIKSYAGGPTFNLELQVFPEHNPLVSDPWGGPIQFEPSATPQALSKGPDDSTENVSQLESSDQEADISALESASVEDSAELDFVSLSDSDSGLNEHGRSIEPELASTSDSTEPHTSSSAGNARTAQTGSVPHQESTYAFSNDNSDRVPGQQSIQIKKFMGGFRGNMAARGLAAKSRAGSIVTVQCKVSQGSKPGQTTATACSSITACLCCVHCAYCTTYGSVTACA